PESGLPGGSGSAPPALGSSPSSFGPEPPGRSGPEPSALPASGGESAAVSVPHAQHSTAPTSHAAAPRGKTRAPRSRPRAEPVALSGRSLGGRTINPMNQRGPGPAQQNERRRNEPGERARGWRGRPASNVEATCLHVCFGREGSHVDPTSRPRELHDFSL